MKTTSFVVPLLTLLVAGVVIGNQRHSIAEVETQSSRMRERLALNEAKVSRSRNRIASVNDKSPIDWKELVFHLDDETVSNRFHKRLTDMSVDELIRSIREVAALDFIREDRMALEGKLVPRLIELDPEAALRHFEDQMGRANPNWRLPKAFGSWLEKDQGRAIAWLDEQIAAGRLRSRKLDGSDGPQASFENHAIAALLHSDPAAAEKRLERLSQIDRDNAIQFIDDYDKIDALEFAQLARQELSETARNESFSRHASRLVVGSDYAPASEYLDRIHATPKERADAVAGVISSGLCNIIMKRKLTENDLTDIRTWVSGESPEKLGEVTGMSLGMVSIQTTDQMEFSEVLRLVNQYYEAGDGESLLFHFLDSTYPKDEPNRQICRELANKITDETRREEILERFK
ncbi:MAG: hypothetical protein V4640_12550 [Verrucomicrobiota bacterium]